MIGRRFAIGCLVKILGKNETYRVSGYHQNIYFAQGRTIIYNRYQLDNIETDMMYTDYVSEDHLEPVQSLRITKSEFDILLDEYNDYMKLYEEFKDDADKDRAMNLINTLSIYKVVED